MSIKIPVKFHRSIPVKYVPSEYRAMWIFPRSSRSPFSCIQVWDWLNDEWLTDEV